MPNAVLRVDPWRHRLHRLHRLHRMYGLSCLHCRLHLSCLHQTPWYLQSAFETLGRSFGRSFGCFTLCPHQTSGIATLKLPASLHVGSSRTRTLIHHELPTSPSFFETILRLPTNALQIFCKVLELHITGHHAPCQERSIEMLEIWRDESLSLNRGRVFLLPWCLECLWNCFTCTAYSAMNVFTTLKAWRTCFTWDPIWDWLVILCIPNVLI